MASYAFVSPLSNSSIKVWMVWCTADTCLVSRAVDLCSSSRFKASILGAYIVWKSVCSQSGLKVGICQTRLSIGTFLRPCTQYGKQCSHHQLFCMQHRADEGEAAQSSRLPNLSQSLPIRSLLNVIICTVFYWRISNAIHSLYYLLFSPLPEDPKFLCLKPSQCRLQVTVLPGKPSIKTIKQKEEKVSNGGAIVGMNVW